MKKSGFTILELTMVLAIVGLVAALTIPSLLTEYHKSQTILRLKKIYQQFDIVVKKGIMKYGKTSRWTDIFSPTKQSAANNLTIINKYFKPYMKITLASTTMTQCWATGSKVTSIDGNNYSFSNPACFKLETGENVALTVFSMDGAYTPVFMFDTNGDGPPNKLGIDIFVFQIYKDENSMVFYGERPNRDRTTYINGFGNPVQNCKRGTTSGLAGATCGALIHADDWEMNNEASPAYPW